MAPKAFILIETGVGKTREVSNALKKLGGVTTVDAVTGPYDIIATVSAPDLNAVGELVTNEVHTINGIVRTVTCLSVSSA
ncbi:MAG: Lrp/AsnC family transcriptional regulator [SAR202 cluster bacterium]|nr:Lrp/AsnC family transcriptional regulator [SAR202 cluster bacterium]